MIRSYWALFGVWGVVGAPVLVLAMAAVAVKNMVTKGRWTC